MNSHTWKGFFSYDEEALDTDKPVPFELYVQKEGDHFHGVVYDDEFRDFYHKLPTVEGDFNGREIKFIVQYPVAFSIDENNDISIDEDKKGHEVIYTGAYEPNRGCWTGIWEILPTEEVYEDDIIYQHYSTGSWELMVD